ncbi:winged helix-turn-helix domain-containing protein [Candidatus Thorarchaeota archaeon]|nr:MAG: winged helix-turn-helix domain-containing protein [Candidatus Thorarchaeota archaeon]
MGSPDETAAKLTLKMAGVFQEVRDIWVSRLDTYFSRLDQLIEGQWFDVSDMTGIINESHMAAKEALDGLANDLSTELVHSSSGAFGRFEAERASLLEEINGLRSTLSTYMHQDENAVLRENLLLRDAIFSMPQFRILEVIRALGNTTYKEVSEESGVSIGKTRKHVKGLMKNGYVNIDRNTRPHSITFLSAPWGKEISTLPDETISMPNSKYHQHYFGNIGTSE